MKHLKLAAITATAALTLTACATDAQVVNHNATRDADNFKVPRRIVFINGITDKYIMTIEGYCNLNDDGNQLETICKLGENQYKKHFLGLSDNVTYFAEQIEATSHSDSFYKVVFKPSVIIPDIEVR